MVGFKSQIKTDREKKEERTWSRRLEEEGKLGLKGRKKRKEKRKEEKEKNTILYLGGQLKQLLFLR